MLSKLLPTKYCLLFTSQFQVSFFLNLFPLCNAILIQQKLKTVYVWSIDFKIMSSLLNAGIRLIDNFHEPYKEQKTKCLSLILPSNASPSPCLLIIKSKLCQFKKLIFLRCVSVVTQAPFIYLICCQAAIPK